MSSRPIRTATLAATAFFTTIGVLSVSYSAYSSLSSVIAGDKLTVAAWTQLKNNLDDLNLRISNFSFNGTNVGVWTAVPTAKLDVTGTVKISDGTQGDGKLLTSDANGLANWTGPDYQSVTATVSAWTTVSSTGNDPFSTADVTLSPGVWKLDMSNYLNPSSTNGCFDIHVDAIVTSGAVTTIAALPNYNSEGAYPAGRHGYLSTVQLIRVTGGNAQIHARRYWSWCGGAYYVVQNSVLTMIATKVR